LELNVDYAINLDGGGSTKILHDGKSITSTLNNRAVDNVIAFYLLPKKIYRIQVGAFKLKSNANSLLEKVRKEAGCQEAYVKCVNGVYKVQVGAFSNKQNAMNLANQLKAKGYNVIITS
jgi:cell division septation protein DedD